MIKGFKDKHSQAVFEGRCPRKWSVIRESAERKLAMLEAAVSLEFLKSPPGNHLERLVGSRAGSYSIRINDKWRICFEWRDGHVWNVEIVDYH